MINDFMRGIQYFFDGFQIIFKPPLRHFIIMPVLVSFALFVLLMYTFNHYLIMLDHWYIQSVPNWLQWLSIVIHIVLLTAFLFIYVYIGATIVNLIAAPFNGALSAKVELFITDKLVDDQSLWAMIKDTPRIIGRQLAMMAFYFPRAILLLVLFFVPIVQLIAAPLWFLFNAWYMTLLYLDYPTDNNRVSFADTKKWMRQRNMTALGFGTAVLIAMLIPIFNIIAIPAAVAGATRFWVMEK